MADKVEFQTIKEEIVEFGKNNFIEIARKKAVTDEGENEFVSISRGFYAQDGTKRYRKSVSLPNEPEKLEEAIKKLQTVAKGLKK